MTALDPENIRVDEIGELTNQPHERTFLRVEVGEFGGVVEIQIGEGLEGRPS